MKNFNILGLILGLSILTSANAQEADVQLFDRSTAKQVAFTSDMLTRSGHVGHQGHDHAPGEKCLAHERDVLLKQLDPEFAQARNAADELTRSIAAEFRNGDRAAPPVYTVPIVFHVIHKGESVGSGTNLSDAQIMSTIDALNRDYRRTGDNGGIALGAGPDTEIQFCLASVDPNGNPTSGINRVNGTSVGGYANSGITSSNELSVKALSRWDNRYYLNIWVVSEINDNGADLSNPNFWQGGTLGYAYLPTNPVTFNSDRDGIVAVNICVGNDPNGSQGFRLWPAAQTNRTLTHEVGHVLGLDHPFDNTSSCNETNCNTQGDGICDTPPTLQGSSCNNGTCPNTIVENYMDYTQETCQDMFTNGQSTVMRSVLSGVRNELVNTNNCTVSSNNWDVSVSAITSPVGTLCETTFSPTITLTNVGSNTLTSVQIEYGVDGNVQTFNWSGSLSSGQSTQITLPNVTTTGGAHTFSASTVSGTLNGSNTDEDTGNDGSTSNFNVSGSGNTVTLNLDLDCYGEETSWEIRDENNNLIASGSGYANNTNGQQVVETFCLAEGCYDFTIADSYGDGLNGSIYQDCSIDGDYTITDQDGNTLVTMTAPNADFGEETTHNFCLGNTGGGGIECAVLAEFDGAGFFINSFDLPNFNSEVLDIDQETVAPDLATNGYSSEWMGFYEVPNPGDTNSFVRATSWFEDPTASADNWINFGPITIPSEGGEVRWKHRMPDNNFRDGYEVLVNFSGTSVADFNGATVLYSVTDNDPSTDGDVAWTDVSVPLPAGTYAGQQIYLAFHHTATDMYFLDLDAFEVEGCQSITVGLDEEQGMEMAVFPNPSSGNFNIQLKGASDQRLEMRLVNLMGQTVWTQEETVSGNSLRVIRTGHLNAGVYTLIVTGEGFRTSERLILAR